MNSNQEKDRPNFHQYRPKSLTQDYHNPLIDDLNIKTNHNSSIPEEEMPEEGTCLSIENRLVKPKILMDNAAFKALIKRYSCQKCKNFPQDPLMCINQEGCKFAFYGKKCVRQKNMNGLNHSFQLLCPVCHKKLQEIPKSDKELISKLLQMKCRNYKKGCFALFSDFKTYSEHYEKCRVNYKMVNCENCKVALHKKDMPMHLDISCEFLLVSCEIKGCPQKFPRKSEEQRLQHQQVCQYKLQKCQNDQCTQKFHKKDTILIEQHQKFECPFIKVQCAQGGLCEAQIYQKDLQQHEKECQYVSQNCPNCKQSFFRKDFSNHVKNECQERDVKCPNEKNGCKIPVKAKHIQDHIKQCQYVLQKCKNQGCNWEDVKQLYAKHYQICPKGKIECSDCASYKKNNLHFTEKINVQYLREQMPEHKKKCQYKKFECKYCEDQVVLVEKEEHNKKCQTQCQICKQIFGKVKFAEHELQPCYESGNELGELMYKKFAKIIEFQKKKQQKSQKLAEIDPMSSSFREKRCVTYQDNALKENINSENIRSSNNKEINLNKRELLQLQKEKLTLKQKPVGGRTTTHDSKKSLYSDRISNYSNQQSQYFYNNKQEYQEERKKVYKNESYNKYSLQQSKQSQQFISKNYENSKSRIYTHHHVYNNDKI